MLIMGIHFSETSICHLCLQRGNFMLKSKLWFFVNMLNCCHHAVQIFAFRLMFIFVICKKDNQSLLQCC